VKVRPRKPWRFRDFVALAALFALGVWLHRQPLADIAGIGSSDPEQSHIWLAPLVAFYLLWLRRSRLYWVSRNPSLIGTAVAVGGWLLSWWGFDAGVQVAWHAGAVVTLIGVVLTFTGLMPLRLFAPVFVVAGVHAADSGRIRFELALSRCRRWRRR
jgi:hypothetical protein